MTVVSTLPYENKLDKEIILTIFSSIGRCRFLDEKHFDACTALSGSGPAFVCLVFGFLDKLSLYSFRTSDLVEYVVRQGGR